MSVNGFTFGDDPTIQKYNYESLDNIPDIENGTYPNMAVGSLLGTNTVTDSEPYFIRPSASIGDREYDEIVGGTVGWNQLCNGSSVTVTSGHKYYMIKGGAKSVGASDGTAITGLTSGTDIVIDLTALFGSTIADYIYSLEQATAGAGVAWFRQYFGEDYYPYSEPTLKSVEGLTAHVMRDADNNIVGNYPLDSTWVGRGIPKLDSANKLYFDGDTYAADGTVTRNWKHRAFDGSDNSGWGYVTTYGDVSRFDYVNNDIALNVGGTKDIISNMFVKGTIGTSDLECINLHASLHLMQIQIKTSKLSTNNVAGLMAYFASNSLEVVYPLATPTEETATPYEEAQICDPNGTEQYVTESIVPVGHNTQYPENLATKISNLPSLPTEAGTYRLKVTVTAGKVSYEWVSA